MRTWGKEERTWMNNVVKAAISDLERRMEEHERLLDRDGGSSPVPAVFPGGPIGDFPTLGLYQVDKPELILLPPNTQIIPPKSDLPEPEIIWLSPRQAILRFKSHEKNIEVGMERLDT
jgi:hypothetical protein